MIKSRLSEVIVPCEAVAEVMLSDIGPHGLHSRHRVGVALPPGERAARDGWRLGQRGANG